MNAYFMLFFSSRTPWIVQKHWSRSMMISRRHWTPREKKSNQLTPWPRHWLAIIIMTPRMCHSDSQLLLSGKTKGYLRCRHMAVVVFYQCWYSEGKGTAGMDVPLSIPHTVCKFVLVKHMIPWSWFCRDSGCEEWPVVLHVTRRRPAKYGWI